jgi:protein-tyrosine phosphatase
MVRAPALRSHHGVVPTSTLSADQIGIHCTHGFNRTGFMIVSYLVEELDVVVEDAITFFARARPPGIYK